MIDRLLTGHSVRRICYYRTVIFIDSLPAILRSFATHGERTGSSASPIQARRNRSWRLVSRNIPTCTCWRGRGTQCLPLYRYTATGDRVDNITDWALAQFRLPLPGSLQARITKHAIFHYVYAVLHHPAYRAKYERNLKRELPRIPFYDDFPQWAAWGEQLMALHLDYEQVAPYPLAREDVDLTGLRKPVRSGARSHA